MKNYRAELADARGRQRESYARFREITTLMMKKGLLKYNRDDHRWEPINSYYYDSVRIPKLKLMQVIKSFNELQNNMVSQAMLLAELEHAIDREEKKNENR